MLSKVRMQMNEFLSSISLNVCFLCLFCVFWSVLSFCYDLGYFGTLKLSRSVARAHIQVLSGFVLLSALVFVFAFRMLQYVFDKVVFCTSWLRSTELVCSLSLVVSCFFAHVPSYGHMV